ncbi:MAG: acetylxylan esterase [Bifidobacteriaceae bacterium]|jgi:cephalosporin-C deacetylase|nr:acetylxylan esterase [Bifidobacteriaceae bacterium]
MLRDLPLEELRSYQSQTREPDDFDVFWEVALHESRADGGRPVPERVELDLHGVEVFDVTFSGFSGEPVKAWLRLPVSGSGSGLVSGSGVPDAVRPPACVVQFGGYGGGRSWPLDDLVWPALGFAQFRMDTRGQGATWAPGDTPDPHGSGPMTPGFVTKGVMAPETYYYARLFTDAARAVDAAAELELVDPSRIGVFGRSQGGGAALAAAALVPGLVRAAVVLSPFMVDVMRGVDVTDQGAYQEIATYLAVRPADEASVRRTLSYVDGVNFARRCRAPAHFATGLADDLTPASTVFGAYNAYAGPKDIQVWPFAGHEGGASEDLLQAAEFFRRHLPETGTVPISPAK